jgi:myo-inositol-1(or 4)-monophosphatase
MKKDIFENELVIAKFSAKKAGEILLDQKNDLQHSIFSSDTDLKLKADLESEKFIIDYIKANSHYPILAEESGQSVEDLGEIFWVIDPLDGTANYARNLPLCCISIALIKDLKPVVGVIYDFNNNDLYEGSINTNALKNNEVINISNINDRKKGILLTGLPNNTDFSDASILNFVEDFQNWRKVRMIGSAAMAAAYVASGKVDVYKENNTYLWDIAAGVAIVESAGGFVKVTKPNDNYQVNIFISNGKIIN